MNARRLLLAAAAALPTLAAAASFDCAKARTSVEHLICADPALSALDERLATAYKAASAHDGKLRAQQREWISGTRNKCDSTACLSQAYTQRLQALDTPAAACAVRTADVVGHWANAAPVSDPFEEADFSGEKDDLAFVSFVHHAPFITGSWSLKDCRIHIAGTGDRTDFDFEVLGLSKGRLALKDASDGSAVTLKKLK